MTHTHDRTLQEDALAFSRRHEPLRLSPSAPHLFTTGGPLPSSRPEDARRFWYDPRLAEDRMVYLGGSASSFRCDCGCNVFRRSDPKREDVFVCNACGARYVGSR